jgi:hypothetical protein
MLALAACGSSAKSSAPSIQTVPPGTPEFAPRPANTMDLAEQAGLVIDTKEHLQIHEHSTLEMTVDGKPVAIPANVGVGETSIAELHTHDNTGLLHVEATEDVGFTLGQFFDEWDVKLEQNCVGEHCKPDATIAITVNDEPYTGDPRDIALKNGVAIKIAIS